MTLRYEVNPPKVTYGNGVSHKVLEDAMKTLKNRVSEISKYCDSIHITDSVLGIPRISPIVTGASIKTERGISEITFSVRVRDRNLTSLTQTICDAILLGINGVLVLKGDPPPKGPKDSGLIPSKIVRYFNGLGFGEKIELFLSLPSNPNFNKIQKKIDAEPTGFITQIIYSLDQIEKIVDELKPQGFKIIPCVLFPSEKNKKTFEFLNLDYSSFTKEPVEFVKTITKLTGEMLISSPNDFNGVKNLLQNLR